MPISRPTLSIADNADGTGGVATIADSTSTTIIDVFAQKVDGDLGTATWEMVGTRTGDGTVNVTPTAGVTGYYWWYCESTDESDSGSDSGGADDETVISNLVYQNLTDGTEAVMERCLTGVQSRIQGLSLLSIPNANIIIHKAAEESKVKKPGVVISPAGVETMVPTAGTNTRDDVGYPVFVGIVAADNRDQSINRAKYLKWRQQIARAFRNQRLPGVTEIINMHVETRDIVAPSWFANNLFVSAMVVRCISREVRGTG